MKINPRVGVVAQFVQDHDVAIQAHMFACEVERLYGKVPIFKVKQAEQLRLPLLAIAMSGRIQANHARKRLEALNAAIEYANGDMSARKRYIELSTQADRLAIIAGNEVDKIGR